jgi:hypothetical protein
MWTGAREERLARRVAELYATDRQFADAQPSEAISAAIEQPGLRLPQLVQTVLEGYADRPALGHRAVQFIKVPERHVVGEGIFGLPGVQRASAVDGKRCSSGGDVWVRGGHCCPLS